VSGVSAVAALGRADARTALRDPLLAPLLVVPPLLVVLLRFGLPPLAAWLRDRFGVDLAPYAPLVASGLVVVTIPAMFGAVAGVLVLDERDAGTLTALRLTPLGLRGYAGWRVGSAVVLAALGVGVGLPLSGLFAWAQVPAALALLVPASLLAPVTALALLAFARDEVAAMAVAKGLNLLLTLPLAAWFVDGPWSLAFGILPTYWVVRGFWAVAAGEPSWPFLLVGTAYLVALGVWLARRFAASVAR
jgi:fluoroquinolone transport system permease protein